MTPFRTLEGIAAPLPIDNVDTDQIIPGRYLKTIGRAGLAQGLFEPLRRDPDGRPKHGFVLDRPGFERACILVAGANFGCGSSREHAPWALLDHGFGCVIASSFADIFYGNSLNCGLLPAIVDHATALLLLKALDLSPTLIRVDLLQRAIEVPGVQSFVFSIEDAARTKLLLGLDAIAETLSEEEAIASHEAAYRDRIKRARSGLGG